MRDNRWTFSPKEALLWIMDFYFSWKQQFEVKNILMFFFCLSFGFTRCKMMDWSGVDYCDVFVSCLDSHSDGTHSLQRIHCWASDGKLHLSQSITMKKQTHLSLGWPEGEDFQDLSFFLTFFFLGGGSFKSKSSQSLLYCQLCHMYRTYIQIIEIALLSYSLVHTDNTKH